MKQAFLVLAIIFSFRLSSQVGMHRFFTQPQYFNNYFAEIRSAVKTTDNGYIFSYLPWMANLHASPTYTLYTIKTDSNFVPQWKKPVYAKAIPLPTGGIVLVYQVHLNPLFNSTCIEKVTASGVQVWNKTFANENIVLNDGLYFYNKIRLVGRRRGVVNTPSEYYETSQAYTLEIDTSGSFISQSLFNNSYGGQADFTNIKRDPQGNFFVYSGTSPTNISEMAIAKFDSSFTFVWGTKATYTASPMIIRDIDFLPNGRIFATGQINGNTGLIGEAPVGALLKFDSLGGLVQQTFFNNRYPISGLCRKPNGNYVVSISNIDSSALFETDTAMNIAWFHHFASGYITGTSLIKNNTIISQAFVNNTPQLIGNDINGNSCTSYTMPYTQLTASAQVSSFSFSPLASLASLVNSTVTSLLSQPYADSCLCVPLVSSSPAANLCIGNTATLNSTSSGTTYWFATALGNSFISSGPQFIYSSNNPTVFTLYAEDSVCVQANRTAITVTFNAIPTLTINASNNSICSGQSTSLNVIGATDYNWSTQDIVPSFIVSPSLTTVYTVTGSVAAACTNTQAITISVTPTPTPTLSLSAPAMAFGCTNSPTVISVSGASTYLWSTGAISNTAAIMAGNNIPTTYSVIGANGSCTAAATGSMYGAPLPNITISAGLQNLCAGATTSLNASGATTYIWNNVWNTQSISVTPTASSVYTVIGTLVSPLITCTGTNTIGLNVFPNPTVNIVASNSAICQGASVSFSATGAGSYTWNTGVNTTAINETPSLSANYFVVGTSANNCRDTSDYYLTVNPNPTISVSGNPMALCLGASTTLSASGASTYLWNNGVSSPTFVVTPSVNTTYTVVGTDLNNCSSSNTINLTLFPVTTLTVFSPGSMCPDATVSLNVYGASSYTWDNGSVLNTIFVSPTINTTYSVIGIDANNCTATASTSIIINPLPSLITSGNEGSICAGSTVTLTVSGANTYSWSTLSTNATIIVSPLVTTVFTVSGTDSNGCVGFSVITQLVDVCNGFKSQAAHTSFISVIPNPNNGNFTLRSDHLLENQYIELFNSLGQLILSQALVSNEIQINIENYAAGVYFIKLSDRQGSFKVAKQ